MGETRHVIHQFRSVFVAKLSILLNPISVVLCRHSCPVLFSPRSRVRRIRSCVGISNHLVKRSHHLPSRACRPSWRVAESAPSSTAGQLSGRANVFHPLPPSAVSRSVEAVDHGLIDVVLLKQVAQAHDRCLGTLRRRGSGRCCRASWSRGAAGASLDTGRQPPRGRMATTHLGLGHSRVPWALPRAGIRMIWQAAWAAVVRHLGG